MEQVKGKFITLEGTDACGKSTQTRMICAWMASAGLRHIVSREPGGTPTGDIVRNILRSNASRWCPVSQILMLNASRYAHTNELIKPQIAKGVHVICDRYVDSTYAYQSALGAPIDLAEKMHEVLFGDFLPDLTLWLDVGPDVTWRRVERRQEGGVLHDLEKHKSFQQKVYEEYKSLAMKFPNRIHRIDATEDTGVVFESIKKKIKQCLSET